VQISPVNVSFKLFVFILPLKEKLDGIERKNFFFAKPSGSVSKEIFEKLLLFSLPVPVLFLGAKILDKSFRFRHKPTVVSALKRQCTGKFRSFQ
jgi:hypothetical protein